MKIKLNCENRCIVQGEVKKLIDGKFLLKSSGLTIPCRIDCRVPNGLKDGDNVTCFSRLRYSNDHGTHKLILEKIVVGELVKNPINYIAIEGYPLDPIVYAGGVLEFTMRSNTLTSGGDIYRCLIKCLIYGAAAKRIYEFIKTEKLYMFIGTLVQDSKAVIFNVEYVKDSEPITREY